MIYFMKTFILAFEFICNTKANKLLLSNLEITVWTFLTFVCKKISNFIALYALSRNFFYTAYLGCANIRKDSDTPTFSTSCEYYFSYFCLHCYYFLLSSWFEWYFYSIGWSTRFSIYRHRKIQILCSSMGCRNIWAHYKVSYGNKVKWVLFM